MNTLGKLDELARNFNNPVYRVDSSKKKDILNQVRGTLRKNITLENLQDIIKQLENIKNQMNKGIEIIRIWKDCLKELQNIKDVIGEIGSIGKDIEKVMLEYYSYLDKLKSRNNLDKLEEIINLNRGVHTRIEEIEYMGKDILGRIKDLEVNNGKKYIKKSIENVKKLIEQLVEVTKKIKGGKINIDKEISELTNLKREEKEYINKLLIKGGDNIEFVIEKNKENKNREMKLKEEMNRWIQNIKEGIGKIDSIIEEIEGIVIVDCIYSMLRNILNEFLQEYHSYNVNFGGIYTFFIYGNGFKIVEIFSNKKLGEINFLEDEEKKNIMTLFLKDNKSNLIIDKDNMYMLIGDNINRKKFVLLLKMDFLSKIKEIESIDNINGMLDALKKMELVSSYNLSSDNLSREKLLKFVSNVKKLETEKVYFLLHILFRKFYDIIDVLYEENLIRTIETDYLVNSGVDGLSKVFFSCYLVKKVEEEMRSLNSGEELILLSVDVEDRYVLSKNMFKVFHELTKKEVYYAWYVGRLEGNNFVIVIKIDKKKLEDSNMDKEDVVNSFLQKMKNILVHHLKRKGGELNITAATVTINKDDFDVTKDNIRKKAEGFITKLNYYIQKKKRESKKLNKDML